MNYMNEQLAKVEGSQKVNLVSFNKGKAAIIALIAFFKHDTETSYF